jgi:hypothetical protein
MNSSAVTKNVLKHVKKPFFNLLQQVFYSRRRIYPVEKGKSQKTREPEKKKKLCVLCDLCGKKEIY